MTGFFLARDFANKRELGIWDRIGEKSQASGEGNGLARVEGMGTTKFGPDKANPDGTRFDTSRSVGPVTY
ncbi:hypothetical protein V6N13_009482 [Hibiscus sabdariffa]